MYGRPPSFTRATVAMVVGNATVAVIGAPGAAFRYRIAGLDLAITRAATGLCDLTLQETGSGTPFWGAAGLSVAGTPGRSIIYIDPGLPIGINQGITLVAGSSAATGVAVAFVYYFIDPV